MTLRAKLHVIVAAALAFLLVAPGPGWAAETLRLEIASDPPGAEISVGRMVVGAAPVAVTIAAPPAGRLAVSARLPGHDTARRELAVTSGEIALTLRLAPSRGLITVNTSADGAPAYDGFVTLREALAYARGARVPRGADRQQIRGPVGRDHGDDIVFDAAEFAGARYIFLGAALPALDDADDALRGPDAPLTVMPATGAGILGPGLAVGAGVSVSRLTLDGFETAIAASGYGEVALSDLRIPSAAIAVEATGGSLVTVDGVAAAVTAMPRLASDGGIIDGTVDAVDVGAPGAAVMRVDPPGKNATLRVTGWLPRGAPPRLFVRAETTVPLHAVPGIEADSSSYEAFRVFGGEGDQKWPSFAVDGGDAAFQWEFPEGWRREYLTVALPRPARTGLIRVRHLQVEGQRLVRYRLALLDHAGKEVFGREVETDGKIDEIAIDPTIDFFALKITVIEAIGTTPGITEIDADILDSVGYATLGHSRYQAVFPRPASGARAAIELDGRLYPIGETAFEDGGRFGHDQPESPRRAAPRTRVFVDSESDAVAADDVLTLREAILFANGERALTPDEAIQVEGPRDNPITIDLAVDALALSAPLPVIRHGDIEIRGNGARITAMKAVDKEAGAPLLRFAGNRRAALSQIEIAGGIAAKGAGVVQLREVSLDDFGAIAIAVEGGITYLARSRIAGGETGLRVVGGALTVVESRFARLKVGIASDWSGTTALIGNRFDDVPTPIALSADDTPRAALLAVGNRATGALDPRLAAAAEQTLARGPRAAILIANMPPRLGYTAGWFTAAAGFARGAGVTDLRTGRGGVPAIHHVDFPDPRARCLIERAGHPPLDGGLPFATVLFDAPLTLWCASDTVTDARVLRSPGSAVAVEDETGRHVLDQRIGVSTFVLPDGGAGGDLLTGFPLTLRSVDLAPDALVPDPRPDRRARRIARIVQNVIKAGDDAMATSLALDAYDRVPGNRALSELATFAVDGWARKLEAAARFDDAADVIASLEARYPDQPAFATLFVDHLHRRAKLLMDNGAWVETQGVLETILSRRPGDVAATKNLVYAYQEWAKTEIAAGRARETIAAIEDAAKRHPEVKDFAIVLNNGYVDAIQQGIDAGDTTAAVSFAARWLRRDATSEGARKTYVYAAVRHAQAIQARNGFDGAMRAFAKAAKAFPRLAELKQQAAAFANQAAVKRLNDGDFAGAVAAFGQGLAIAPGSKALLGNLRIAFINQAIEAANAGRFRAAATTAERGLKRFPGDPKLIEVRDYARQRQ